VNGFDIEGLAIFNHPGTPWLDFVMSGASSNRNLWVLLVLTAVYLWRKSPHGFLAVVLLGVSVGTADLVSVRLVKPAVARSAPAASILVMCRRRRAAARGSRFLRRTPPTLPPRSPCSPGLRPSPAGLASW